MFDDILTTPSQIRNSIPPVGGRKDRINSFKQRLRDFEQGKTDLSEFKGTGTLDSSYDTPAAVEYKEPKYNEATSNQPQDIDPNQDVYQPEIQPTIQPETQPQAPYMIANPTETEQSTDGMFDTYTKLTNKAATSPWATVKDMFGSLAAEKNTIDNATLRGDIYRNINPKLEAINDIDRYKQLEQSLAQLDSEFENGTLDPSRNYFQERNELYNNILLSKDKAKDALVYLKTDKSGAEQRYKSTQDYNDPDYQRSIIQSDSDDNGDEWAVGWSDVYMNNRKIGSTKAEYNFTKNINDPAFMDQLNKEKQDLIDKKNENLKDIQTNNDDIQYWKSKVSSEYLNKRGNTNNWLEYGFYEVPALAGSFFANLKEQALATGAGVLSGSVTGSGAGPIGTAVGAGLGIASAYYTMEGRKKESLAELSEGYEDRLRQFYGGYGLNEGTMTPEMFSQITGVDPSTLPSNPKTSEQLFQSLMLREAPFSDQALDNNVSTVERKSLSGANVLYDLNNTLGVIDAAQIFANAFPIGRALKANVKLPVPTAAMFKTAENTLDNVAESGMRHSLNKLVNGVSKGVSKASEIWNKIPTPIAAGVNIAKKGLLNGIAEGSEEGAQFSFQQDFKSGKYDNLKSGLSIDDLAGMSLQSNWKVYGTILGFNPDPLLKDNDEFWENVKGGFALGLGMGGGHSVLSEGGNVLSEYRSKSRQAEADYFVKSDFLNEMRRQAALDQVSQQDDMNKSKMYVDQIVKGRSENVLQAFDQMRSNLPQGLTEEVLEQEIEHFNRINEFVNNSKIDSLRKSAKIEKGSLQHGILIGLIDRHNNELIDARDSVKEANDEIEQVASAEDINTLIPVVDSVANTLNLDTTSLIGTEEGTVIGNEIMDIIVSHNRDRVRLALLEDLKKVADESQSEFNNLNQQYKDQFGIGLNDSIGETEQNPSRTAMLNVIEKQINSIAKNYSNRASQLDALISDDVSMEDRTNFSTDALQILDDNNLFEAMRGPYLKQILSELRVNDLMNTYTRDLKDGFKTSISKHVSAMQKFADTERNNTTEEAQQVAKDVEQTLISGQDTVTAEKTVQDNLRTIPTEPIVDTNNIPSETQSQPVSDTQTQTDTITPETTESVSNAPQNASESYSNPIINSREEAEKIIKELDDKSGYISPSDNKRRNTAQAYLNKLDMPQLFENQGTVVNPTPTSNTVVTPINNTRRATISEPIPDEGTVRNNSFELIPSDTYDDVEYPDIPLDIPTYQQEAVSEEELVDSQLSSETDIVLPEENPEDMVQGESVANLYENIIKDQSIANPTDSEQTESTTEDKVDARVQHYLNQGMTMEQAQRMVELVDSTRADIRQSMGNMNIGIDPAIISSIIVKAGEMLGIYLNVGVRNLRVVLTNMVNDLKGSAPDQWLSNTVYRVFRNTMEYAQDGGANISDYIDGYDSFEDAIADSKNILDSIFNTNQLPTEEPKVTTAETITPVEIIPSDEKKAQLKDRLIQGLRILTFENGNTFNPKLFGNNQSEFDAFVREAKINGSYEELNNKLKKDSNGFINNSTIFLMSFGLQSSQRPIVDGNLSTYANQYIVYLITDKRDGKRYAVTYPNQSTFMSRLEENINVGQYDSFMDMSNADGLTVEQIRDEARNAYLLYAKSVRDMYIQAASLNGHKFNDWRGYLRGQNKVSPVSKSIKYITNNLRQQSPGIRDFKDVKGLPITNFSKIEPGNEFTESTMPLFIMKGDPTNPSIPVNIINYKGLSIPAGNRNILVESGRVYTGAGNTPTILLTNKKIGEFPGLPELIYDLITRQQDSNATIALNLNNESLHFTPSQLIDFLIGRKKIYNSKDADAGTWWFGLYNYNGVNRFRIGLEDYDSNSLMNKQKVLEAISNIDFNGRNEKHLFGYNPGTPDNDVTLKNSELANYVGNKDIKITDRLLIKKSDMDNGTTWLGWYLNNNIYSVNIADNPLTKSIETSGSFSLVTDEGYQASMLKPESNEFGYNDLKVDEVRPDDTYESYKDRVLKAFPNRKATVINKTFNDYQKSVQESNKKKQIKQKPIKPDTDFIDDFFGGALRPITVKYTPGNMIQERENLKRILGESFVNSSVSIVDDVINVASKGIKAFGITRNDSIILYNQAEEGTAYHEAYHRVSLLLLDRKEREKLYNSFRRNNKEYSKLDNQQIEEELAEGFRTFVLTEGYVQYQKDINNWFNRLYNFIKRIFNVGNSRIKYMYNKIYAGDFVNAIPSLENVEQFNSEYNNIVPFKIGPHNFNAIPTYSTLTTITRTLLGALLLSNNITSFEDVENGNIDFDIIFDKLKSRKESNKQYGEYFGPYVDDIITNKAYFVEELKRKLSALNINVNELEDYETDQKENSEEPRGYGKESFDINMRDYAPLVIKLFLGTVPRKKITSEGVETIYDDYLQLPMLYDYAESYKRAIQHLGKYTTFKDMYNRIKELSVRDPFFAALSEKIDRYYKRRGDQGEIENFNTAFYQTMHMFSYNYVRSNVYMDNDILIQDANLDQHINKKTADWNSTFADSKGLFNNSRTGQYVPNKEALKSISDEYIKLNQDIIEATAKYENEFVADVYIDLRDRLYSILNKVGIVFPEANGEFIDQWLVDKYGEPLANPELAVNLENLNRLTSGQARFDNQSVVTGNMYNFFVNDINNITNEGLPRDNKKYAAIPTLDIFKSRSFIKEAASKYGQAYPGTETDMTKTAGGGSRYKYSLNSYITDQISNLENNANSVLNMKAQTPANQHSLILKALLDTDGNRTRKHIKLETYTGLNFIGRNDKGRDYTQISPLEDYVMKMSALFYDRNNVNGTSSGNGRLILPILADRKTTHFLNIEGLFLPHGTRLLEYTTNNKNNSIVPVFSEAVVKIFHGYFLDELNSIRQAANLLKAINEAANDTEKRELEKQLVAKYHKGDWNKKGKNGLKMRFFKKLSLDGVTYENLDDVLGKNSDPDSILGAVDYIENKYSFNESGNINYQDRTFSVAINNLLNDLVVEELNKAIELGAIHSTVDTKITGTPNFASLTGLDPKTLEYTLPKTTYNKFQEMYNQYGNLANGLSAYTMIADYTINNIISISEVIKMFSGDIAFHNDFDAFVKRLSIMASTGNSPRQDQPSNHWNITNFENYTIAEMEDSEVVSDYYGDLFTNFTERFYEESDQIVPKDIEDRETAKKEYAKKAAEKALGVYTWKDGKAQINQGDGGVYISPEMFKKLMIMDQGWSQDMEDAYKILQSDDEWWTSPSKTLKVSSLIMQPLKYVSYNTLYQAMPDGTTFEKIVADKMALFTVWKRTATGDLSALYNRMNDPNKPIDMIKFNSAVKAGNGETFDMYSNKEHTELNDLSNITTYSQNFNQIRKQLITDPHSTDDNTFGTQVIKAALSNIIKSRIYDDINIDGRNDWTGEELSMEVMKHINALSDKGAKELMNEFGSVDDEGNFTIDETKVSKMLMREAESAGMTSNVIDALKINPLTNSLTTRLSAISDHNWLQSRLISIMNDKTINVHSAGGAMIQQSSFGLVYSGDLDALTEHAKSNLINGGKKLRFLNKNGSMDAVVSINLFKGVLESADKWYIRDKITREIIGVTSHQERVIWLREAGIIGENASPAVLGYRIPTQGQSSISSLTIVDVLPENVGDTIILPDEFTALTGSDFDIDKLYVARYYYNKNGSKVEFKKDVEGDIYENNSKEANVNRMIDIYMGLLNSKYHIHETRMPLDNPTNHLKKTVLADIDTSKIDRILLPFEQLTPHFQLNKKDEYFTGKSGLGPFALNNVHHVLSQLVNLSFKSDDILDSYGIGDLSRLIGNDNYKILDWLNAMISAHVDVAKDSYVIRLGVNSYTYNMTNFLIRSGVGSNTFYFLAQDIIKDISLAAQKAIGKFNQPVGLSVSQIERRNIEEVKTRYENMLNDAYKAMKDAGFPVDQIENYFSKAHDASLVSDKIFKYNKDGKSTFLSNALTRKYRSKIDISNDVQQAIIDYQKQYTFPDDKEARKFANETEAKMHLENIKYCVEQLQMFTVFSELKPYSETLSELVTVSQVDTKKYGNNFIDMRLFMNRIAKVKSEQAFNNLNSLFDKTFLGKKIENSLKLLSTMFKNMLIVTTDQFAIEHNQLLDLVGSIYTRDNVLARNLSNAIEGQFKSEFFNQYTKSNNIDIYSLFFGENSVPNRVNNIKADIAEGKFGDNMRKNPNALLDRFTGLTQGFETEAHGMRTRIVFDNGSMLKDDLVLNWSDLLNSEYPEIKKLGEDLIIFAFYSSQDKPGKNTFFDLAPYEYRDEIGYNDFIARKEVDYVNGVTNFDADDIFQNNWHNDNIVPFFRESKDIVKYRRDDRQVVGMLKYLYPNEEYKRIDPVNIAPHTIVDGRPNSVTRQNRFGQRLYRPYYKYNVNGKPYLYRLSGIYMKKGKNDIFTEAAVYKLVSKKGYHSANANLFLYNNDEVNNKIADNKLTVAFQNEDFLKFYDPIDKTTGQVMAQSFEYIYDIVPDKTIYDTDRVTTNQVSYQENSIINNENGTFTFNSHPINIYSSELAARDENSVYIFVDDSIDLNTLTFTQFKNYVDKQVNGAKRGILKDKSIKFLAQRPIGNDITVVGTTDEQRNSDRRRVNLFKAYLNNKLLEIGINNFGYNPTPVNGNLSTIVKAAKEQISLIKHNYDPFIVVKGDTLASYGRRVRAIKPSLKPNVIEKMFADRTSGNITNDGFNINQTNINSQITLQMQPDNIQKILNGTKTTTTRSSNQASVIGLKPGQSGITTIGGKLFNVTNRGELTIEEAGGRNAMEKSENFENNTPKYKQTVDWLNGIGKLFVYDITPINNQQPTQQTNTEQVIDNKPITTLFQSQEFILSDWGGYSARFLINRNGQFVEGQILNEGVWDNNPSYQESLKGAFNNLNKDGNVFSIFNLNTVNIYNMYTDILKQKYPNQAGSMSTFIQYWNRLTEQEKNLEIRQILECLK